MEQAKNQIELYNKQRIIRMLEEEINSIEHRLAHSSTEAVVRDMEAKIVENLLLDIQDLEPNMILDEDDNILFLNEPEFERGQCFDCDIRCMDDEYNVYCVFGSPDECPIHKAREYFS